MSSKQFFRSARSAVASSTTTPTTAIELSSRFHSLSIYQRRPLHATCRCLASVNLHGPPPTTDKAKGAITTKESSKPKVQNINKTQAKKAEEKAKQRKEQALANRLQRGGLASSSIFADAVQQPDVSQQPGGKPKDTPLPPRNPETLSQVLNPRPVARALWQRKMLVRSIQKRGRLTKAEKILQAERSSLSKSHFFKTSMKKLAPLARQISGKTIDEAILQMRFSKKKVAKDVREHLIHARNEAIVARGMGLGAAAQSVETPDPIIDSLTARKPKRDPTDITGDTSILPPLPTQVPTLALRRGVTPDPTQIYIDQAWVNRGPYGQELEPRAMGRANILRPPHTGLSVLLKEEKTRMREGMDKESKERRQRLGKGHWRQLPDRKIYHQRAYYSW